MKQLPIIIYLVFAACLFSACEKKNSTTGSDGKKITILYTNDEHGWMEPFDNYAGAAGMSGFWEAREGYDNTDPYLVLSGGDMWTGPAISTWFQGEPMVEVMNQMGYDAAALGNHEFDFTVDILNERLLEMSFPVLAANIVEKSTGNPPGFVEPFLVKTIDDIKVGIIGLASLSTPYTAFPDYVEPYEFTDYATAVEKYAVELQDLGVDLILIIGHICLHEMEALVPVAKKHKIPFIGGGHCHQSVMQITNGVLLAQTNGGLKEYAKVELEYDKATKIALVVNDKLVTNNGAEVDNDVKTIVDGWKVKADEALSEEIGYCNSTIEKSSVAMGNMVCDSWFYTFPEADVSITNSGGIRQDIFVGSVTVGTIVGLLPFENSILKLKLTGTELLECIDNYLVGGVTTIGGNLLSDGSPIVASKTYTVLTTDYLYSFDEEFSLYDPAPENTSVNFRQPLIDWIKSLNITESNPLNNYLDNTPRR